MESIRVILRRNGQVDDVERQQPPLASAASTVPTDSPRTPPEMEERSPSSRFGSRFSGFSRPTIPSFFSRRSSIPAQPHPRPSSSHYSDEPLESPKSPRFSINMPHLPSTRLHLPNLARTWTSGSNGPPSRPGTARPGAGSQEATGGLPPMTRAASRSNFSIPGPMFPAMAEPEPAVPAGHVHGHSRAESTGSRLHTADPAEQHLADLAEAGRERRRRRHRRHGTREGETREERRARREARHRRRRRREQERPTPKHFLFCFPWVRSKRVRSQILKCFVSGTFLVLLLTIYLSLSLTKNVNSNEFSILLILIILFTTIFFCHGLIRLCILLVKPPKREEERRQERARQAEVMSQLYGPGGYAIPREPIQVVLARDEEAAGIESDTTKLQPPAYGLWRESVRVDPNRIYWQRNEHVSPEAEDDGAGDGDGEGRTGLRGGWGGNMRRPPSYASDDGISYVVEARPRSIAPSAAMNVPLATHPSESGRAAQPPRW